MSGAGIARSIAAGAPVRAARAASRTAHETSLIACLRIVDAAIRRARRRYDWFSWGIPCDAELRLLRAMWALASLRGRARSLHVQLAELRARPRAAVPAGVCPCQSDDDDPAPHIPSCPWSDPAYEGP